MRVRPAAGGGFGQSQKNERADPTRTEGTGQLNSEPTFDRFEFICWLYLSVPASALFSATSIVTVFFVYQIFLEDIAGRSFLEYFVMSIVLFIFIGINIFTCNIFTFPIISLFCARMIDNFNFFSFWRILALTPLLALITFYSWKNFIPIYGSVLDERPYYFHGLTWERFLNALAIDTIVVVVYWRKIKRRLALLSSTT